MSISNSLNQRICLALVFTSLAFSLACCDGGCGGCDGSDEPDTGETASAVPEDWSALTVGYAQHLPSTTHVVAVSRGFAEAAATIEALKPRLRPIFDLTVLENEIRSTFGFDLGRPVTLGENGVAYDGGFVLAIVGAQPVIGFYLTDPEPFLARAEEVLRRQPFNLRAPVERRQVGEANIHLFSRRRNQPVEFAVVIDRGFGFLIPRVSATGDLVAVATAVAETDEENCAASSPELTKQLERFEEFPGFLFIDSVQAARYYRERLSDQLSATRRLVLDQTEQALMSMAAGVRLEGDVLSFRGYASVAEDIAAEASDIDQPLSEQHPQLQRFVLPSTFFGLRLGIRPSTFWSIVLRFQGERGAAQLQTRIEPFEEALGMTIEELIGAPPDSGSPTPTEALPSAISGNVLILVNRLAPISLVTAQNLADYADALGLVIVAQLADREHLVAILDRLASAQPSILTRIDDGDDVVYRSRAQSTDFGNLIIRGDTLILAPDRVRRQLTPDNTAPEFANRSVGEILRADVATGVFLRFAALQPIAIILNWPQALRDVLQLLDTLTARASVDGSGIVVDGHLLLTPLE